MCAKKVMRGRERSALRELFGLPALASANHADERANEKILFAGIVAVERRAANAGGLRQIAHVNLIDAAFRAQIDQRLVQEFARARGAAVDAGHKTPFCPGTPRDPAQSQV